MKFKRILSIALIMCMLMTAFTLTPKAAQTGVISGSDGSLNVRDGAGTNGTKVIDVLKNGTVVTILSSSGNWFYISYTDANGNLKYGYVSATYVTVKAEDRTTSTVPSVYASYINRLKSAHPNWQFKFYNTGIDWKDVVSAQTKAGKNAIAGAPLSFRSTSVNFSISGASSVEGYLLSDYVKREGGSYIVSTSGSKLTMRKGAGTAYETVASVPNGTAVIVSDCVQGEGGKFWYKARYYTSYGSYSYKNVEGSSWFQPHGQVVRYYLDPRNFLNDTDVFQFEQLAFDNSVHTEQGVIAIIRSTFMNNTLIQTTDGRSITYAKAIMEAAAAYNVSPYHLASRIIQEVGTNGSVASRGNSTTYPGIYNFYNIGAYTGVTDGLRWASQSGSYGRPWDSQYKSIMGGAQYIAEGFINKGQSTLYFQKFDVVSNGTKFYDHQYMSNIVAPSAEGKNVAKAYKEMGIDNSNFVFLIPVYNNMPSFAYPLPARYDYPNMLPDSDNGYLQQFSDVNMGDWYFDAVKFVYDEGYMFGYGNGKFGVTDPINREDFAVVLSRLAGANIPAYKEAESTFPDVKDGSYYYYDVMWANDRGLITGYNNGKFGVGDKITREQVCTIIYRYAQSIFRDVSLEDGAEAILNEFSDADTVSEFAREAMAWCISVGIIKGNKDNKLMPQNTANRAEMAVMVQRMVQDNDLCYKGYPDVQTGSWYYDAVQTVYHKGYISGYKNGKFGPEDSVQRQDFIVIMSRVAGINTEDYAEIANAFPDVANGSYYCNAVKWSVSNSIMTGYNNGNFGVGDKLTRQDACTVICRFARYLGIDTEIEDGEIQTTLDVFDDADSISAYAQGSMAWCVKNGIISGKNAATLAPLDNISRAQIAQILLNMINNNLI